MELTKDSIAFHRLIADSWNNYEETTDSIVPDTFPDVRRIAAVYGTAQLKDDAPQTGRVLISGTVHMTVLYVPDDGGLRKLDIPISFAHIQEAEGINEDSRLFVTCRVVAADAHIMNSRKISAVATLSICCRVFCPDSVCLTNGFSQTEQGLETLSAAHTFTVPVCVHRREFTLMDDVPLPDSERYAMLCAPRAEMRPADFRLMNGKAVLKGDIALHLLAVTKENTLENADCVLPFTQIFEVDGMTEQQQISICFSIRHIDAELRDDGTAAIGLGTCVFMTAYETHTVQLIEDVYHLSHPIHTETQTVCIPASHPMSEIGCEASETIPVGMKIAQIADTSAVLDTLIRDANRSILRMMVCIVYRSDDGEYYAVHRAVQMPLSLPEDAQQVRVNMLQCRASATISGEDSVLLSLSGRCSLLCDEPLHINDLSSIVIEDGPAASCAPVSVILRHADAGERLWDIAKSYRTTVEAIRQANQLSAEHLNTHAQMLLIPVW